MAESLLYFAYGSNMSVPRLAARIGAVHKLGVGRVDHHALRFHKSGRDGSAKCDIHETGDPLDEVFGVVFEVTEADRLALDDYEGRGKGYEVKTVTVTLADGRQVEVFTYYATDVDAGLRPYHWYKSHVLKGADEHALPASYQAAIQAVQSVDDPDPLRHAAEMAIHAEPPERSL